MTAWSLVERSRPQSEDALCVGVGVHGGVHDQHGGRRHLDKRRQLQPIEGFRDILIVGVGCRRVHPAEAETEPVLIVAKRLRPYDPGGGKLPDITLALEGSAVFGKDAELAEILVDLDRKTL